MNVVFDDVVHPCSNPLSTWSSIGEKEQSNYHGITKRITSMHTKRRNSQSEIVSSNAIIDRAFNRKTH